MSRGMEHIYTYTHVYGAKIYNGAEGEKEKEFQAVPC